MIVVGWGSTRVIKCPDNCKICASNLNYAYISNCTYCFPGYRLSVKKNICTPCEVEKCSDCITDSSTCDICLPFHYYNSTTNSCLPCSTPCLSCSSPQNCTSCRTFYRLSNAPFLSETASSQSCVLSISSLLSRLFHLLIFMLLLSLLLLLLYLLYFRSASHRVRSSLQNPKKRVYNRVLELVGVVRLISQTHVRNRVHFDEERDDVWVWKGQVGVLQPPDEEIAENQA